MKLIVGLGNPGSKYTDTRHNVGFRVLDHLANTAQIQFKLAKKTSSELAVVDSEGTKILLAKPTTYMNRSGQAVNALAQYYQIEKEDILIMYDEIALPFGTVRTRLGGESAGHNGIKSIIEHIGSDFGRARIGIGNEQRSNIDDKTFVLSKFTQEEQQSMGEIMAVCESVANDFIAGQLKAHTYTIET